MKAKDATKQIEDFSQKFYKICNTEGKSLIQQLDNFNDEYKRNSHAEINVIAKLLDEFSKEIYIVLKTECGEMEKWLKSKVEAPELNYLEVFWFNKKEETYTRFLEWLLKPESNHNLRTQPLYYFLQKIVNTDFPFNLNKEVDVKAEKVLEEGTVDLKIKGENFTCFIENKIRSSEGKDQTARYYKSVITKCPCFGKASQCNEKLCPSKENTFFIYLTLNEKEPKCIKFVNKTWFQIIDNVLIELLKLQDIEEPVKTIIKMVIYNLQGNVNPKIFEYFNNLKSGKYNNNLLMHYLDLIELKKKIQEQEKINCGGMV